MTTTFWMTAQETEDEKRRRIPQACPKCGQPMLDGEIVVMDWAGEAVEHVRCERTKEGQ